MLKYSSGNSLTLCLGVMFFEPHALRFPVGGKLGTFRFRVRADLVGAFNFSKIDTDGPVVVSDWLVLAEEHISPLLALVVVVAILAAINGAEVVELATRPYT